MCKLRALRIAMFPTAKAKGLDTKITKFTKEALLCLLLCGCPNIMAVTAVNATTSSYN